MSWGHVYTQNQLKLRQLGSCLRNLVIANQHNNMDSESLHSNALMNYAGLLYSAYMKEARAHHNMTTPTWADFVCDPLNKVSVFCWVEVARVALKIETEVRDAQL